MVSGIGTAAESAAPEQSRSDRKRHVILAGATGVFLHKGYDAATMDDVAATAAVSKPTIYKYFSDKPALYAAVVESTVERIDETVALVAPSLAHDEDLESAFAKLARNMLEALLNPETIALRRLVIANADRFPEIAGSWYDQGFGRVLATLSDSFSRLAEKGRLRIADPLEAANHFAGLLLWIPVNELMFGKEKSFDRKRIDATAQGAATAFLRAYG